MAEASVARELGIRGPVAGDAAAPVLTAEEFGAHYGRTAVLSGITLAIRPARITAIMGPSGCGKSTFLRSLNRMNDRTPGFHVSGGLRFFGQDIYGPGTDPVALRRRIGMVFQKPVAFAMSIFDNVAYGPRVHRLDRGAAALAARVERCLTEAGLWAEVRDRLRQPAATLSGGQQQRLAIARALAVDPDVLLLDEPTSAIDPVATARIEDTLGTLARRLTIVIVTHNLQQAARISAETAFLLGGQLVEAGPTERVFQSPQDPRTNDYLTGRFG